MADQLFKIVRFRCGGIDVHKNLLVVSVCETDPTTLETRYDTQSFSGFNCDLDAMCKWILAHGVNDVAMESTGKYWVPVANKLEEHGIKFKLVHPKYVKAVSGQKNDKADSRFICSMHACDLTGPGSVVFPLSQRDIRDLARRYWKLGHELTAEKNRLQNCMTVSNLGLDSVFSDPFGKSAQAVMDEVLKSDVLNDDKILSVVHSRCKNKNKVLDAVHGSKISPDQRFKMADISKHLNQLKDHRDSIFAQLLLRLKDKMEKILKLTTIPGISVLSAILITSEIGMDMSFWKDGRQLASWAGMTPSNDQSHSKKKSTRITKSGLYLKPLLVQCALAAIKNPKSYFGIKYNRISRRRGHKKAVIAIARMILISVYYVIKNDTVWKPSDYDKVMNPKSKKVKKLTAEDHISALRDLGYDVSLLKLPREPSPISSPTAVCPAV
jgi:transposase